MRFLKKTFPELNDIENADISFMDLIEKRMGSKKKTTKEVKRDRG
jgi:hypothetical protein